MKLIAFTLLGLSFSANSELAVRSLPCENNASYPVHLSFDDGPSAIETGEILRILESRKIKATFLLSTHRFKFLVDGTRPTEQQQIYLERVAKMKRDGHTVGNHSYEHLEHANSAKVDAALALANFRKSDKVIKRLDLKAPVAFRFPYGSGWFKEASNAGQEQSDRMMKTIKQDGYLPFHWDIDTWDWSAIKRKALPDSMLEQICSHKGGVVLLHDTQPFTAENLEALIDSIERSGHKIVSFDEIKASSKSRSRPLASFSDSAVGIFSCRRPVTDVDQVWSTCDEYLRNSYDTGRAAQ